MKKRSSLVYRNDVLVLLLCYFTIVLTSIILLGGIFALLFLPDGKVRYDE